MNLENFLAEEGKKVAHYGVPGMRWGIRRLGTKLLERDQKKFASKIEEKAPKNVLTDEARKELSNIQKTIQDNNDFYRSLHNAGLVNNAKALSVYDQNKAVEEFLDEALRGFKSSEDFHKYYSQNSELAIKLHNSQPIKGAQVHEISLFYHKTKPNALYEGNEPLENFHFLMTTPGEKSSFGHSEALSALLQEHGDTELKHYGIKGMRWGFRRTDAQLARARSGDDGGSDSGGSSGGSSGSGRVSADAERFADIMSKPVHEMSDVELRTAVNRANQIKQYNQLFAPENKSDLQRSVEQLQLQKQYRDLSRELTPEKRTRVKALVSASSKGFKTFKEVDNMVNHDLSKALSRKLGLAPKPTALERLKAENELLSLQRKNTESKAQLAEVVALKRALIEGDQPSRAIDYAGVGKRRSSGRHNARTSGLGG